MQYRNPDLSIIGSDERGMSRSFKELKKIPLLGPPSVTYKDDSNVDEVAKGADGSASC